MPKWAVLQRLTVILWGLIKGDGQSGGTQGSGFRNTSEFNLNMFHHDVILSESSLQMKCSLLPGFHGSTTMFRWKWKSPLLLYAAPWNPLFQAIICVLGPVFPWKKRCDSDSPIGPEPFPFCNLHPFFTFVPSIGSAYVWFVASFWVICSAFPTHNFGGSISHRAHVGTDELPFLLFGNDIPCFPRLLCVSVGVISIPAMAAHSNNKAYAGLSGITIVNRLAFIITIVE